MGYSYAVIGAGRQGVASAYDLVKFGEADKVILIDSEYDSAVKAAELVNNLIKTNICSSEQIEAGDHSKLKKALNGIHSIVSGVPYFFNYSLTQLAIEIGANFCDLGGNTNVVQDQLKLNDQAKIKNVSIVPDCGMDPGLNISLIMYLVDNYDKLHSVKSYGAGLTQNPVPPWNYEISFHINGLTNEYYGNAFFLRDSKVTEVACFDGFEELNFPEPIGRLEAAVTSGGLSTLPWTLEGKVDVVENKTLRYPGHWARFKAFSDLGLFEETPVKVNDQEIIPRDFYHTLLGPKISARSNKDIGIIKIFAHGIKDGKEAKTTIEIIDRFDEKTGFTAMQRLTGWHASVMAILSAQNRVKKGAVPVEQAVAGSIILDEIRKRGIEVKVIEN